MAWRLRLLNDAGDVVGWATLDPHEFWVDSTLPDASRVEAMLKMVRSRDDASAPHDWVSKDGVAYPRMTEFVVPDGIASKERLDQCGSTVAFEGWVADYELIEE